MDLRRIASVRATVFFALLSCFKCFVAEPAEFAGVDDLALFLEFIYQFAPPRETTRWVEIGFTSNSEYGKSRLKHLKIAKLL